MYVFLGLFIVQLLVGLLLIFRWPALRSTGRALLFVVLSQLVVPASVVGLSILGHRLNPPPPTPDPLGPDPWWSLVVAIPLAWLLNFIGCCMVLAAIFKVLQEIRRSHHQST